MKKFTDFPEEVVTQVKQCIAIATAKKTPNFIRLMSGVYLVAILSGCAGLAAITGQGGTYAEVDEFDQMVNSVKVSKSKYPGTAWQSIIPDEAADLIYFVNNNRVLVGTVESGAYLGVPDHKQLTLYDVRSGAKLWQAERDSFRQGGYSVFKTEPFILLLGQDDQKAQLQAIDTNTGKKIWELRFDTPTQTLLSSDTNTLFLLDVDDTSVTVRAISCNTGKELWKTASLGKMNNKKKSSQLLYDTTNLYVVTDTLSQIDAKTGIVKWHTSPELLAGDNSGAQLEKHNIFLWHGSEIVLLDAGSGKPKWQHDSRQGQTRLITANGEQLYRVFTDKTKSELPQDVIQSIRIKDGKINWSQTIDSQLASPLIFHKNRILFSTDTSAFVLQEKSGQTILEDRFPNTFASRSPSKAALVGQADIIHLRNDNFFVARERAGVAAYSLGKSRRLWIQMHHNLPRQEYSAEARSLVMLNSLAMHGKIKKSDIDSMQGNPFSKASSNSSLQATQRSIDYAKQQNNSVLRNQNSSRMQRQSALQSNIDLSNMSLANTQVQIASERLATEVQFASAILGAQDAIASGLRDTAIQGMVERIKMTQYAADTMRARRFQDKYYVRATYDMGRGLTIIDLDSGKRADFLIAPMIPILYGSGLDLQSIAVDEKNQRLVTVGVGMDDTQYKPYVKWKHRIPMTSVLTYDIGSLDFTDDDTLNTKVVSLDDRKRIIQYAGYGLMDGLKAAVESGVDVNSKVSGTTPLHEAAMGSHVAAVQYLLNHGADVSIKDAKGRSAVDVTYDRELKKLLGKVSAQNEKDYQTIRQLLIQAGSNDSAPQIKALDKPKNTSTHL